MRFAIRGAPAMPTETIVVVTAVSVVFIIFALVLAWVERATRKR